nr:MAG TPA: hypothetical protein [Caudoviricetes sp.]
MIFILVAQPVSFLTFQPSHLVLYFSWSFFLSHLPTLPLGFLL